MTNHGELAEHTPEIVDDEQAEAPQSSLVAFREHYPGPLPHPSILSGYDQIVPGAAERIIQMAERDQQHKIDISNAALHAQHKDTRLG